MRSITISNAGLIRWPKSTSLFRSSSQRFGASSSSMVVMAMRVVCDAACEQLRPNTLLSAWNFVSNSMRPWVSRSSKRPLCFIKAICKEKKKTEKPESSSKMKNTSIKMHHLSHSVGVSGHHSSLIRSVEFKMPLWWLLYCKIGL